MLDPEIITSLQKKIVHIMANQLEEEKVTEAQLSEIAEFVLERTEEIDSPESLVVFLEHLSERWPMFHDLYVIEAGRIKETHAEEKILEALNLTKEGRIEEALQVAKSTTY